MRDKELIDRLLSGKNRMSSATKDAIFEDVMDEVAPSRKRKRWFYGSLGALVLATGAALLIPRALHNEGAPRVPEFAARGDGAALGALTIRCSKGAELECARDSKLLFDLHGTTGYTHFAALVRHTDGTVTWFVPASLGATSLTLSDHLIKGALDQALLLGAAQQAGEYEVYGFYSKRPLTQETIKSRFTPEAENLGPETLVLRRNFRLK